MRPQAGFVRQETLINIQFTKLRVGNAYSPISQKLHRRLRSATSLIMKRCISTFLSLQRSQYLARIQYIFSRHNLMYQLLLGWLVILHHMLTSNALCRSLFAITSTFGADLHSRKNFLFGLQALHRLEERQPTSPFLFI